MGKGGCVDGQLITTLYTSPVPWIGLYIAAGTLVCFFYMTFDMVSRLRRRKPFIPCKLFPMNAFTMTVLAVATKIPLDLTSPMPRASDQLCKLTATALMCTSIGFYMPSLGTMGTSERYGNMAALSIMVITMVVNVGIQLGTGVIFEFMVEHIIIMVCILVLLVLMWSSTIAFSSQKDVFDSKRLTLGEGLEGLKSTLGKIYTINYESNPQTLLCTTTHHHAFGILCAISSLIVLVAIPRSFIAPKNMKFHCSGASDYKWSIPMVIVIQFMTIAVGTFSIIYRWFSFMWHYGVDALVEYVPYDPEKELVDLKEEPIVLTFVNKNLSDVLTATKDIIMGAIIWTQKMLYGVTRCFFGLPLYYIAKFLGVICCCDDDNPCGGSILFIADEDMARWKNARKEEHPTEDLIKLISIWCDGSPSTTASASASTFEIDCCHFVNEFEASARDYENSLKGELEVGFEYRFSCMTLLVLSGIIEYMMPPSPSKVSLRKCFKESFEIIHFVDHNCISTLTVFDQAKLVAAKKLWVNWDDHILLVGRMMRKPKESKSQSILEDARSRYQEDVRDTIAKFYGLGWLASSTECQRSHFMAVEISFLCNFILGSKNFGPDKDLWRFLEECFVRMVCYMLVMLPSAIVKEISTDYVTEIDETRLKRAWKFFFQLESLKDTIKWYWPKNFSQANDAHSNLSQRLAALLQDLAGQASVSEVINEKVEEEKEDDDGDTIKEIQGSDGFV